MAGNRPGPRRSKFQRVKDQEQIGRLYLLGVSQMEIAAELGLSQSQVSRDITEIQSLWRKSALVNMDEAKARELAKIDNLEREAWSAWRDSRGERIESDTEQIAGGAGATKDRKRVRVKKVKLAGNPEFLKAVQWCVDKRCQILGILGAGRGPGLMGVIDFGKLNDSQLERIGNGEDPLKVLISGSDAAGAGYGAAGVAPAARSKLAGGRAA